MFLSVTTVLWVSDISNTLEGIRETKSTNHGALARAVKDLLDFFSLVGLVVGLLA